MMGQFVVVDAGTNVASTLQESTDFNVFPNPTKNRIYFTYANPLMQVYYVTITNAIGRTICMLPRPQLAGGIDVSTFAPGVYFVQLTDEKTKTVTTRKFVKE